MTFSILAVLCITLYTLRYILLWWKALRRGGETPVRPKISPRDLQKVLPIAALMIVERTLYRYASQFALGLELTVLKVISHFLAVLIEGDFTVYVSHLHLWNNRISLLIHPPWIAFWISSAFWLISCVALGNDCFIRP